MPIAADRSLNLVEALAFSAFVAMYIWLLQARYKYFWIVFLLWLLGSFLFHKDTRKTLGWRVDNLWPAGKQAAAFFVPCILALCIIGTLLGGLHRSSEHLLVPQKFFGYMSFCLVQQVGLNSYVTNRLLAATDNPDPRVTPCRRSVWRPALAQSRARSRNLVWRHRNVLAVCASTQHYFARYFSRHCWHTGVVGFPGYLASRHARGPWFLFVPSTMIARD